MINNNRNRIHLRSLILSPRLSLSLLVVLSPLSFVVLFLFMAQEKKLHLQMATEVRVPATKEGTEMVKSYFKRILEGTARKTKFMVRVRAAARCDVMHNVPAVVTVSAHNFFRCRAS